MNTQRLQNSVQNDFVCVCNRRFDSFFDLIRDYPARRRVRRERKELYRYFSSLDQYRLRDVGMHDPAVQMKVLGRYL